MTEHGDAIQILFTCTENGESHMLSVGAGNWYARKGMAETFLDQDRQVDQANFISEAICIDPPDGDAESWKE